MNCSHSHSKLLIREEGGINITNINSQPHSPYLTNSLVLKNLPLRSHSSKKLNISLLLCKTKLRKPMILCMVRIEREKERETQHMDIPCPGCCVRTYSTKRFCKADSMLGERHSKATDPLWNAFQTSPVMVPQKLQLHI